MPEVSRVASRRHFLLLSVEGSLDEVGGDDALALDLDGASQRTLVACRE